MTGTNDFCGPIILVARPKGEGVGMTVASRLLPEPRAERPRRH